jgi:hypothetical protein
VRIEFEEADPNQYSGRNQMTFISRGCRLAPWLSKLHYVKIIHTSGMINKR